MADDLFQDLPPPISARTVQNSSESAAGEPSTKPLASTLLPALKSALKRPKTIQTSPQPEAAPEKKLRFKTTTDASEKQVIEAMQKIASHIKNVAKFSKASKLAVQLIQAGSIKESTSSHFFAVLEAAMASSFTNCNEPSIRSDYHALFSAAQDVAQIFNEKQQDSLNTWTIRAVWANDLFTDDSFVFSKATGRIKEAISALPAATKEEDDEEAVSLKDEPTNKTAEVSSDDCSGGDDPDPFGLDVLMPKGEGPKAKNDEEYKTPLRLRREALISCLEIAAKRYKTPWCQTSIDILSKHAFDEMSRFTARQRDAIWKLWSSIREQETRRKQGKSVSGKLDVNGFEWLQQKYSTEKISIRHSVGGSGDRKCEQWLG
ncbi:hypothetical protein M569_00593 [Genlisea aurea]|uniref:Uncharacterized protein n=1 Tax=Genlisea aurea TaxID=192259 RepID=S8EN30_9LAMI|nr:hypothetical protein M569_00593 [Genlisea aurea]